MKETFKTESRWERGRREGSWGPKSLVSPIGILRGGAAAEDCRDLETKSREPKRAKEDVKGPLGLCKAPLAAAAGQDTEKHEQGSVSSSVKWELSYLPIAPHAVVIGRVKK